MCDETTERDHAAWLARRDFGKMGMGAAAAMMLPGCAGGAQNRASGGEADMISRKVRIETPDGTADALFVHPAEGKHPAILMWPDIAGLREAFDLMATRLAGAGYAVLAVNQYYRSAPAPVLSSFAEWRTESGKAKLQPMIARIGPAATMRDADAFVSWLDRQDAVDGARGIGSCGYCMGGPFAFRAAARRPERVRAIASFHGANLVSDAPDSPHQLIDDMRAALLVAIAENDDARQLGAKDALRQAAQVAGRAAEVEVYPAQHGWCVPDSPVYERVQAERAWDRMLATWARYL